MVLGLFPGLVGDSCAYDGPQEVFRVVFHAIPGYIDVLLFHAIPGYRCVFLILGVFNTELQTSDFRAIWTTVVILDGPHK